MRIGMRGWLGAAVVLAGVTVLPYLQTAGFALLYYDDNAYVFENAVVRQGLSWGGVAWAFQSFGYQANWHPLTWLSLMTDVSLFGVQAGALHLVNVLLHAAGALVLLALLYRLTGSLTAALLAAAFWAVHPLRVESVAWVSQRKDVLSTLLGLLAIFCHLRAATTPTIPAAGGAVVRQRPRGAPWRWHVSRWRSWPSPPW